MSIYVSTDGGVTSERHAKDLPTTGTWTYWTPAGFPVVHSFRVEAVGDNGSVSTTGWITSTDTGLYGEGLYGRQIYGIGAVS